jgi:hypothetical protein
MPDDKMGIYTFGSLNNRPKATPPPAGVPWLQDGDASISSSRTRARFATAWDDPISSGWMNSLARSTKSRAD